MLYLAGLQQAFELRVDQQHASAVDLPYGIALYGAAIGVKHRASRAAGGCIGGKAGVERTVVHFADGAAQVLAQCPLRVQAVAEQIAKGFVFESYLSQPGSLIKVRVGICP